MTIVDDNVYEGQKDFYATLTSRSERVSIANNRTRIVINDNDGKHTINTLMFENEVKV